jgi:spermidine synthase
MPGGGTGHQGVMEYVEIARAETDRGELVLRERREPGSPSALELRANGVFVMDTLETGTEEALAEAALELVEEPRQVLVGGLGLGYTMHAVLADKRVERCSVVEIEQSLVDWMRDGTVPHGPALLADERATLVVADVSLAIGEAADASYDLVLLDVDNGPGYLVHDSNAPIYQEPFLEEVRRLLRPGGALAVWSADRAEGLEAALREVFGNAEARPYDVRLQGRAEHYWLHVARVPSSA